MKQNRRKRSSGCACRAISAGALALTLWAISPDDARAEANTKACKAFVGTYLITNFEADRSIDSRSLIIFSADGTFVFIDSNQAGIPGEFEPFTDAAGAWSCDSRGPQKTAQVVTLDFTLPGTAGPDQEIARLDFFDVTVDRKTGAIRGGATLRFFPFDGDPLNPPANTAEPFFFEGQRVTVDPSQGVD